MNELNDNQHCINFNPTGLQHVAAVSPSQGNGGKEEDKDFCLYLRNEAAPSLPAENQGQ